MMDTNVLTLQLSPQNAQETLHYLHLHPQSMYVAIADLKLLIMSNVMMETMLIMMDAVGAAHKNLVIFVIIMMEVSQYAINHIFVDSPTTLFH